MAPRRGGAAGAGEGRLRNEMPKPVERRLQAFGPEWERLTSEVWVLQTIKTGYRIEFTGPCRLTRSAMWTRIPAKESHRLAMETGLRKMLEKRAIKIVDPLLDGPGFYSSLFLVEKRSGGWRPILNLKELNVAVTPPSVKMDTLQSVLVSLLRRGYPPIPDSKYAGLGTGHVGHLSRLRGRLLPSSDRTGHERRIVHSPSVEIPVLTSGEHDVSGPKSQTTHTPASVLRPEPMVPGHAGHNPDTPDPECPGPARVVVRPHQLDFRSSFLHSRPGTNNSDRCFILRMRRSPGLPDGFWRLARPMEEQAHQLVGTPGSMADSEAFPGPSSRPSSGSPLRQLHHGLLHQQAGRDAFPDPMPPGPGHVGMVRPTGHCANSSPSSRDTQRPSGRAVQGEVLPDGVVPTASDAQSPVLNLGDSHGRPVRNTEEQETTNVLLPLQGTRVERGQCPDSELGRSVRVCIPPPPPIALLPRVLSNIRLHPTAEVIIVAPFWPSQIWFHPLTQMLVDFPRRLPDRWNLLKNSETGELYPEPSKHI